MDNDRYKEELRMMAKTLLRILKGRLDTLEEYKRLNGRLDGEILDTKNDIVRYKHLLEELDEG